MKLRWKRNWQYCANILTNLTDKKKRHKHIQNCSFQTVISSINNVEINQQHILKHYVLKQLQTLGSDTFKLV